MSKRLELFDKLLAEGSRDPFHHYARALELRSLGRDSEALGALSGLIEGFPDYVPSYLMAAQLAVAAGDVDRAGRFCDQGLEAARRAGNDHAQGELTEFRASLAG
ncbi:MAG TPA: tetratricopeptide repeat protein [Polyangiales bacterium]